LSKTAAPNGTTFSMDHA